MLKAYSLDLRERVARFVDSGRSRHAAAAHFKVSVSFVVNLMKTYRTTGRLEPKPVAGGDMLSSICIGHFCWLALLEEIRDALAKKGDAPVARPHGASPGRNPRRAREKLTFVALNAMRKA